MFDPFTLVIEGFARRLGKNYRAVFGKGEPDHAAVLRATAQLALERIVASDAVYHDVFHTLFVTDVGQAILHMANLPLESNIFTLTIKATKMPFEGRG